MIKEQVTLDELITFLNELIKLDPNAMTSLFSNRPECNMAMADHPTVQVGTQTIVPEQHTISVLGVLNGLFGISSQGWGPLTAVWDEPTSDSPSWRLTGFERTAAKHLDKIE